MPLLPGTSLGVYTVTSALGAGGMGEVYRARDTKLNRDVALKILPGAFASDPDRLMRFEREAQTLAALNHPNIAAIYGMEESGATRALVMELVEGDDLSVAIARGPMPLADALPIARQIADALEAAHDAGVIHRDLKPANVKVRADGTVKVLDFGLAKAVQGDGSDARQQDAMTSPTMTSPAMTAMGVILGTAAYMAPEQARGRQVDRRADIWAFGAVLYEMLAGRRAFAGNDVSDLLVSVLRDAPDFSALPAETPAPVRRLLRRCLEKDPRKRLSAIGDARLELDDTETASPTAQTTTQPSRGVGVVAAVAMALVALAAATAWYLKPAPKVPVRLLELPVSVATSHDVALSPDGARLAYMLDGHLYVRALDSLQSQELVAVNASSSGPFWSPDGKTIGFSAESEIRTVPAAGGPVFGVCKIPATGAAIAARWLAGGTIVFAVWRENVYSVPAAGGTPTVAVAIDPATEIDVHHISEAPGARLIVLIHTRNDRMVSALVDGRGAGGSQPRAVLADDPTIFAVDYAAPDRVVFERQNINAGLWVAPFTAGPIDLTKATLLQAGARSANVASDGSVTFELPAQSKASLVWIDRTGAESAILGGPLSIQGRDFAVSPDGRRAAIVVEGENGTAGVFDGAVISRDLETGADTSLTFRAARPGSSTPERLEFPSWFPSGDRLLLTSGGVGAFRLVTQRSDEATPPRELVPGLILGKVTRDGHTIAGIEDDRGRGHLMYVPLSAEGVAGAPQKVFHDDEPDADDMDLSPDGRLVVFAARTADQRHSVFLSEFPTGTSRWQISESASRPRFSADGREIFYLKEAGDGRGQGARTFVSRVVKTTPVVSLGPATELFGGASAAAMYRQGYNVAPDGRRFLTLKSVASAAGQGMRLIWMQNWPAALGK
jgi:serine/threonine protein kinase